MTILPKGIYRFNVTPIKIAMTFFCRNKKPTLKFIWNLGTSLAVQWLRLHASTAGGMGLIPCRGNKILHAMWHGQKIKK